jgi:nicotinamide mononucleotide adenylyltransferase
MVEELKQETGMYMSYFIGRCNPPHQAHFEMIHNAISTAVHNNGKALIILGSGPKPKSGTDRRTEKDPLNFDLKKQIIEQFIWSQCSDNEAHFEIVEMINPTHQVIEFVETELHNKILNDENVNQITVEHFAGGKDDDASKLEFVSKALKAKINLEFESIVFQASVNKCVISDSNNNDETISATTIRDYAYNSKKDDFVSKYSSIYGNKAIDVYNAIKEGKEEGDKVKTIMKETKETKKLKQSTVFKTTNKRKVCKLPKQKGKLPKQKGGKRTRKRKRKQTKRKMKK